MEDYKKKYEEALGRARTFSQKWQGIEATDSELALQELKEIFPELKESEDERIRKSIIDLVEKQMPKSENKKWMIAWLEKQGEQNPTDKVEPKFKVGDVIRLKGGTAEYTIKRVTNTTYYTDGWSYGIERCEEDYELVEQNPTEDNCKISDCDTKVDMTEYNNGYECGKQRVLKYPEDYDLCKKCVWSEEDKKEWNHLIGMLEGWLNTFRETIYKNDCNKTISWLKSLKERVKPQTKQEWTGYDEKAYEIALLDIDKSPSITKNDTIDWLKSLKEKYAWKPSDEQMEALLKLEEMHVLEHEKNQENAHLYMVIKSLKEQLLKLKGE